MNISGIRPYSGFYNTNQVNSVKDGQITEKSSALEPQEVSSKTSEQDLQAAKVKQTFGAYDYTDQYRPDVTFDMKGADSDLRTLDVEKAISDMQKDEVLHQYQFFVGESNGTPAATPSVRGAENFSL